jgi:hypothetical protein
MMAAAVFGVKNAVCESSRATVSAVFVLKVDWFGVILGVVFM